MGQGGDGAVTELKAATARTWCPAWGQAARSSQLTCCREQVTEEWGEGSPVGTHGWLNHPERLALGQRGCSEVCVGILGPHVPEGCCMPSSKQ